jgi:mycofactocin system glycosyltransferase
MRYLLDASYRRPGDGKVVIGGSPLRLFRLSTGGARVMRAIELGHEPPVGHAPLTDRLVDAGAIHPSTEADDAPFTVADVTVVCPAFGRAPDLGDLPAHCRTVVVDDASDPPVVAPAGTQTLRRRVNGGPAVARNEGLATVDTALVAFIDTDVHVPAGTAWLERLLAHFADPRVALVAPRVRSDGASVGVLAAYERARSPLDMGDQPARIAAGTRVSYVPAAAIVCRTEAMRAVHGFDATMRVGEDVDLAWRLAEAGWRCRYEPAIEVVHEPRRSPAGWLRQRVHYGSSAAPLALRHPGALAPLRVSGWSAAVWALVVLRRPFAALSLAGGTTVALRRKLGDLPWQESARLAGLGHLHAGRQIADAVRRVWWPIVLAGALVSRRVRRWFAVAMVVPPLIEWIARRGPVDPVRYTVLRIADDAAYGAGVWKGAVATPTAEPLLPDLTNWPRRGDR